MIVCYLFLFTAASVSGAFAMRTNSPFTAGYLPLRSAPRSAHRTVYQYRRQIAKQVRPSRTAFKNIPPNSRGKRSKSQTDCQGSRKSPETFDTYEVTLAVIKNCYKNQASKISSRGHRIRLPLARVVRNPRRISLLKSVGLFSLLICRRTPLFAYIREKENYSFKC